MDKSNWVCIGGKKAPYSITGSCLVLSIVSVVVSIIMTWSVPVHTDNESLIVMLCFAIFFLLFYTFRSHIIGYNIYINEKENLVTRLHESFITYNLETVQYRKLQSVCLRKNVQIGGEGHGSTKCSLLIKYEAIKSKKSQMIILCDLPVSKSFQFPSQSELEAFTRNEYRFYPRRNLNEAEWIEFNEVTSLMRGGLSVSKKLNLKYEFLM